MSPVEGVARRRPIGDGLGVSVPARQVRAVFTEETTTVYQAYPAEIAGPAMRAGRFVPPIKRERMTWVKPSFPVDDVPLRVGDQARSGAALSTYCRPL